MISGLALRVGIPIVGAILAVGAWYAYKESLRSEGREQEKQVIMEQIHEQAKTVEIHEEAQDASRLQGLEKLIAEKDRFNRAMLRENGILKAQLSHEKTKEPEVIHETDYIEIEKEVEKIVKEEVPCTVPDELVDRVDYLAGLLNQVPYNRVPGSEETDGQPALPGLPRVACDALVNRIQTLTSRLGHSMIVHRSLSEQVVNDYEAYQTWKKEQVK